MQIPEVVRGGGGGMVMDEIDTCISSRNLLENGQILTNWIIHFSLSNYKQEAFQKTKPCHDSTDM